MRQMMNRECAVLASSGKKKSGLDRDITADVPLVSCSSRSPLEAAAFPPFAFFVWSFFFLHDVGFCAGGARGGGGGFLLFIFFFARMIFLRMMQKKKKLCRIVSHRCFSITRSIKDQTWCVGVFESEFRAWLSLIPFSSIFVDRCCQRGEIGLR